MPAAERKQLTEAISQLAQEDEEIDRLAQKVFYGKSTGAPALGTEKPAPQRPPPIVVPLVIKYE